MSLEGKHAFTRLGEARRGPASPAVLPTGHGYKATASCWPVLYRLDRAAGRPVQKGPFKGISILCNSDLCKQGPVKGVPFLTRVPLQTSTKGSSIKKDGITVNYVGSSIMFFTRNSMDQKGTLRNSVGNNRSYYQGQYREGTLPLRRPSWECHLLSLYKHGIP